MNAEQRSNLLKLAAYLESLPRNYRHFDMYDFAEHNGDCELPMPEGVYAAKEPSAFLANCGTVACAVGHGPAAGFRPLGEEFGTTFFRWGDYGYRVFGTRGDTFEFMFGCDWARADNHHYGAAARIRYFLESGVPEGFEYARPDLVQLYASYRKGSRSAKRREIECAQTPSPSTQGRE